MKKTLIILLSFSLFSQVSFAQESNDTNAYKTNYLNSFPAFNTSVLRGLLPEKMIHVDVNYIYASSHISNGFATDFYFNNKIDPEKMQKTADNVNGRNTTGIESDLNISYFTPLKNNIFLTAGYRLQSYQGLKYSGEFYQLLVEGNAKFEDSVVNSDGMSYHKNKFDQVYIGFMKRINNDMGASNFYGSIGIVRGISFDNFDAELFRFYTAPYGQEIDITMKSNYDKNTDANVFNGIGLGLNGGFEGQLTEKSTFNLSFSNLGIIQWNNQTLNYQTDTTLQIKGNPINFSDPFSFNSQNLNDTFRQFLYGHEKKESKLKALPAQFDLTYRSFLKEKLLLDLKLRYISAINYNLKFTVGLYYFINQKTYIYPSVVFGGYSTMNLQFAFAKNFGNKFGIQAGVYGLESLALFNDLPGMGGQIGMFLKL